MHILKFYDYFLYFFKISVQLYWKGCTLYLFCIFCFPTGKSGTEGKIQEKRRWKILWQQKNLYGKKKWITERAHWQSTWNKKKKKKCSTPTCFNFSLFFHQFLPDIIKQPFGPCFMQHVLGKADDFMPLKSRICPTSSLHRCSHQCSNQSHGDWLTPITSLMPSKK